MTAADASWASEATVKAAVERKWARGALLRDLHTQPEAWETFPLRVRLPGPTREELPARFAAASTWARALHTAAETQGWKLLTKPVRTGGLGTQQLPVAAVVPTPQVGLALLSRAHTAEAARFATALRHAETLDPAAAQLALDRPHDILAADEHWPLLLDLADWIRRHPQPGIYPRQIPVAGVHTKILEQHTSLMTRLLDALLPPEAINPADRTFAARYGFARETRRVRLRGNAAVLGVPQPGTADVDWDIAALAALDPHQHGITELLVLENKTSFLTVPGHADRLVLWGAGYGVADLLAALPWRDRVNVRYWGDIDTHGFAMLARVRAVAPHTTSLLMDADTLLTHRPFWGTERTPRIDRLTTLTTAEQALYTALCTGEHGEAVRLEQEFIRFDLVEKALAPDSTTAVCPELPRAPQKRRPQRRNELHAQHSPGSAARSGQWASRTSRASD